MLDVISIIICKQASGGFSYDLSVAVTLKMFSGDCGIVWKLVTTVKNYDLTTDGSVIVMICHLD